MQELYDIFLRYPQVSTDSRNIPVGSIFFALKGASFDGNTFAIQAFEHGAAYAVCDDRQVVESIAGAEKYIEQNRIVFVSDVLASLQELAAQYRRSWSFPVLAITGTNGKTTTKELLSAVLSTKYKVHATKGNLNNHIGVPLTILSAPRDTDFAVIEMGASARGEIALLCRIAAPDYGIITNIGRAHLEGFGDEDGVERGKGELYDWLATTGGTAFYRASDDKLRSMVSARPDLVVVGYDVSLAENVETSLTGDYNKFNIAAAVAIGDYFGMEKQRIATAVSSYVPSNNRSQSIYTLRNMVIVDCYNANPSSMAAAIDSFTASYSGAKTAILGDMLELGEFAEAEHRALIDRLANTDIGELWLVGPHFAKAYVEYSSKRAAVTVFDDMPALIDRLRSSPLSGRTVLLKGSRGIGLEKAIPFL